MQSNIQSRAYRAMQQMFSVQENVGSAPAEALPAAFWCGRVAELQQSFLHSDAWTLQDHAKPLERVASFGDIVFQLDAPAFGAEVVVAMPRVTAYLYFGPRGRINLSLAGTTHADIEAALAKIRGALPKDRPQGHRIVIKQWSYRHGGRYHDETIDVCPWSEIAGNYHAHTRANLDPVMRTPRLGTNGKLALWLGPPGTGKTWALRALAWEQRASMVLHYVLDPEVFLERPDYVMSVFRGEDQDESVETKRSRLIVLEDAGELLGADAMAKTGHGLSRLLNLTDGLPGQAARTRVLITTNEEVGRLHPAVTRPGRCASLVRFSPLDEAEAREWLVGRAIPVPEGPLAPRTVAELFDAAASGALRPAPARRAVGFSASP